MRFKFHPAADAELDVAVEYYERCQSGLGLEFAEEVYATIARIIEYPEVWSPLSRNTRRCLTNRFPYGIIYRIKTTAFTSSLLPIYTGDPITGKKELCRTIVWRGTRSSAPVAIVRASPLTVERPPA